MCKTLCVLRYTLTLPTQQLETSAILRILWKTDFLLELPLVSSFSNPDLLFRESLSRFWRFVVVKLDQFHETETKHSNPRSGDQHNPSRMLHRAPGKTDWQVPGAPLFYCLSPDLSHRAENEEGKGFLTVIEPTLPKLHQKFSWSTGDVKKASLPQHLAQKEGKEKGLGLDCRLFLETTNPERSFLAGASPRVQQMAQLQ